MPTFKCTVKAIIYTTKEVIDVIEVEAPDEVQAEEDAKTAAELIDSKVWLEHPEIDFEECIDDIEFEIEDVEEKENIIDNKRFLYKKASKEIIKTISEGKQVSKELRDLFLDNHPDGEEAKDKDGNIKIKWSIDDDAIR